MSKKIKKIGIIGLGIGLRIGLGINIGHADNTGQGFSAAGLGWIDGYSVIGTENNTVDPIGQKPRLINTIQNVINRVLGILGLIALILCLRGGFQMLTAAGDDSKVKTGTKVLKHAAIGLAVIGLSWLLVTFIFYLINRTADGTGTGGGGGG